MMLACPSRPCRFGSVTGTRRAEISRIVARIPAGERSTLVHALNALGEAAEEPAEAVDPVCGMTVTAGPASHPLEHEGVTYHFCRAGCRREFEQDPAAYARKETRC